MPDLSTLKLSPSCEMAQILLSLSLSLSLSLLIPPLTLREDHLKTFEKACAWSNGTGAFLCRADFNVASRVDAEINVRGKQEG